MSEFDQVPIGVAEFVDNAEPRCPCILLLDVSQSMSGDPIAELNRGIVTFKDELAADALAMKRVEVAVVTFGPVEVASNFQTADSFRPAQLVIGTDTPMGAAIELALDMLDRRKADYRANGIDYYRPWVFLITDGAPTDSWQRAAQLVHEGERASKFAFFAVGVRGAQMDTLARIAVRQPVALSGLKFRELFKWLSSSLKNVSRSNPGDRLALPPPSGWTEI